MKYVVTLNGKNYEVEVTECDAVLLNVTDAVAAPAPVAAPAQAPAAAPVAPAAPAVTPVAAPAAPKAAPVVAPAAPSAPAGAPSIPHFGSSVAEVKEEPVAEAPKANDNGFEDDQFYIMINDIIKGKDNQ